MNGENYKQINKNEENNNLSPKVNLKDSKENQSAKFSIVSNDSLVQSNNNLNEHFFDSNNINDENIENEENENEEEDEDEENIKVYEDNYNNYRNINEVIKEVDEEYDETMRNSFPNLNIKKAKKIMSNTGLDNIKVNLKKIHLTL